eukprot:EC118339.1.p2 GENE.EC118339.1~~EC118339.1.p2  ORF type:complete len:105 (-),score=4.16 EC118339.1:91-405(-)
MPVRFELCAFTSSYVNVFMSSSNGRTKKWCDSSSSSSTPVAISFGAKASDRTPNAKYAAPAATPTPATLFCCNPTKFRNVPQGKHLKRARDSRCSTVAYNGKLS